MGTTRRIVIGGAGLAVLGALGYRAWDRGVFEVGQGPAFKPWDEWRGRDDEGPRRPLHAAILAANPHDTQPWLFAAATAPRSRCSPKPQAQPGQLRSLPARDASGRRLRDRESDARRRGAGPIR